jgi:hypothetical protein
MYRCEQDEGDAEDVKLFELKELENEARIAPDELPDGDVRAAMDTLGKLRDTLAPGKWCPVMPDDTEKRGIAALWRIGRIRLGCAKTASGLPVGMVMLPA